jgi:hypothetical protein
MTRDSHGILDLLDHVRGPTTGSTPPSTNVGEAFQRHDSDSTSGFSNLGLLDIHDIHL